MKEVLFMENKFADLYTLEGENLPEIPWNVYPRPQMKRDNWQCLNGLWEYAIRDDDRRPDSFWISGIIGSGWNVFRQTRMC